MTALPTILEAMADPALWRRWFRDPEGWQPWRCFLSALFGLSMDDEAVELFRACTGRSVAPEGGFTEAWLVIGRRGGKSFALALAAVYLACFRDWSEHLVPGERGYCKVMATDRRQARTIYGYARALIAEVPALAGLLESDSGDELVLTNGITIEIQTASFRSVRGYTVIAALCDEIAFWRSDDLAANPDREIIRALRPAMATVPGGATLLAASSPYAKRGELWSAFRRHYGRDGDPVLVWQADSRTMNPSLPQSFIDAEYDRDPEGAAAEYGGLFRTDIADFVDREVVEAAVPRGLREIPPGGDHFGFTDTSGAGADSYTLGISHREPDGRVILDLIREVRPPFSPESVTEDFAQVLKDYRVTSVHGDKYAGEWPREQFRKYGIDYVVSERTKSEIYLEFLPLLNSGKVQLLDHQRLISQLCGLERKTSRVGKDSVDHGPGGRDDVANAAAGALALADTAGASSPLWDLASFPVSDRW